MEKKWLFLWGVLHICATFGSDSAWSQWREVTRFIPDTIASACAGGAGYMRDHCASNYANYMNQSLIPRFEKGPTGLVTNSLKCDYRVQVVRKPANFISELKAQNKPAVLTIIPGAVSRNPSSTGTYDQIMFNLPNYTGDRVQVMITAYGRRNQKSLKNELFYQGVTLHLAPTGPITPMPGNFGLNWPKGPLEVMPFIKNLVQEIAVFENCHGEQLGSGDLSQ